MKKRKNGNLKNKKQMLIMKYLNNIKLSLVAAVFVCTGTVFTGWEDDLTISGSTDKLETVDGVYGYVRSAAGARELTPITLLEIKREQDIFSLS